ncbi:MAG TPA: hypothetical protein VL026_02775, partial [Rhizomicrobium sp.]|nr:hypothetical protein [Rhizomicrobium sp.]
MSKLSAWLRRVGIVLAGLLVIAGSVYAGIRYQDIERAFGVDQTAQTQEGADTPFAEHIKKAGVQVCSSVFPALGQALTNGADYTVASSWDQEAPEKHAIEAVVGLQYATKNYRGPAAGIVFAVPNGSGCEGEMVRVAPFPVACEKIPAVLQKGSKQTATLK